MAENRKAFSKEFKQKAVELSDLRGSTKDVARELGVRPELIYRWRSELQINPQAAFSGNGNKQLTEEQRELARLRRELDDVKMERDILKKAVSIFSANDRKSINS
jgi:transposase